MSRLFFDDFLNVYAPVDFYIGMLSFHSTCNFVGNVSAPFFG